MRRISLKHVASGLSARRRGVSFAECVIAAVLLGTVGSAVMPTLLAITQQRRAMQYRQEAMVELSNIMERIGTQAYDDLQQEQLQTITLSDWASAQLPQANLTVEIRENSDPPSKQVQLILSWQSLAEQRAAPIRLSAWFVPEDAP